MNPLNVLQKSDGELYSFFDNEIKRQQSVLSFIPDENTTSPLCAYLMGSILLNGTDSTSLNKATNLEQMTCDRICKLFNADKANIRTITIEAASRVVFQALTSRGDVVMSLDLRKKEHCNSENLAYRFVNFGVDPASQTLNLDVVEQQAKACKPHLIILSPINYPLAIDYERLSQIAKSCGAILWCDISQIAGLIAGGVLPSPLPYADVVTFASHGSMQGPQSSVILCKKDIAGMIERVAATAGHKGLLTPQLAALSVRIHEMGSLQYKDYAKTVVENAKALAKGLTDGGVRVLCGGSDSHLVMVDTRNCAVSARGAQELLADVGICVRICSVLTSDPNIKFDAVRFSTLPATTRGLKASDLEALGKVIATFLNNPNDFNTKELAQKVKELSLDLPFFNPKWMSEEIAKALA